MRADPGEGRADNRCRGGCSDKRARSRKGWLAAENVLNTRHVDDVLAFARARHARPRLRMHGA